MDKFLVTGGIPLKGTIHVSGAKNSALPCMAAAILTEGEVVLENIPNGLATATKLLQFEELTHVGLNYAFDTGHANMHEGVESAYNLMKERIRSTHVHDNNGKDDSHLFPLLGDGGRIDWKQAMALLRSREDHYPLLLELKERPDVANPMEAVLEVFDKLESN